MYKKIALMFLGICFCFSLLGCGSGTPKEKGQVELTVFAASSLTESLTQLGDRYMAENKGIKLIYNFDSSGTLKTQIQEGAECDAFISAGQKQMNLLEQKSLLLESSCFNILENKVALVVPKGNPKNIKSYADLAGRLQGEKIMLAIGNADVPVGQYTLKLFNFYKLKEQELAQAGKLTYSSNVKEVTLQVSEGAVDAGIVYQTDATSAKLQVVDTATKEMCGQVIYPAAILKASKKQAEAQKFMAFLKSAEAGENFKRVGFTPLK